MFPSWSLGRLAGIPLFVHPTFLLLPLLVILTAGGSGPAALLGELTLLAAIFGCVVLHELGHALAARTYGIGTRDITLYPIGGVARLEGTGRRPSEEVVIALAGPAVNLAIVLFLLPVAWLTMMRFGMPLDPGLWLIPSAGGIGAALARFLTALWLANIVLFVFNLLPLFPMDGGRVLRAALSAWLGRLRGTEIAVHIGTVLALCLGVLGLFANPMLVVLAAFVALAGRQELEGVRQQEALRTAIPVVSFSPGHGSRLWIQWHDGRPVAVWQAPPE